ncbi:putative non-specific serine/threonine protein kinase [Rosa chinensis]|uniref:Putative non-specific serine/threonine protein kinase n=1 Tax=Rosa chinensis TaxID=74649 RepID=A0A2P6QDC3_ROSCH|nr:putative non-specific serine/threonine protein kinase [Rosa chinensis]
MFLSLPSDHPYGCPLQRHIYVYTCAINLAHAAYMGYQLGPSPSSESQYQQLGHLTSLTYLNLSKSSFSGQIPSEISKLSKLSAIDLSFNYEHSTRLLRLEKASQLRSLVQNLTNLKQLHLSGVYMPSTVPDVLVNASSLTSLRLENCGLSGEFPSFVFNLMQLRELSLDHNQITGHIPSWLVKLTQLTLLNLRFNYLQGAIPGSLFHLHNLEYLDLCSNKLIGSVVFDNFPNLKKLRVLQLSSNELSLQIKNDARVAVPKLEVLKLGSCNLTKFPGFLRNHSGLVVLDLSDNHIHGQIPKWMWSSTRETLLYLNLSRNSLSGFDQNLVGLPWRHLQVFELGFNRIQGSLPTPPPTIKIYSVPNNVYSGEMSVSFCKFCFFFLLCQGKPKGFLGLR